ncbi:unnamed protein product [Urochloa humidicola]
MKVGSASPLIVCSAIFAALLIILSAIHVEPVDAGWRQPLPPPSPQGRPSPRGTGPGQTPSSPPQPPAASNNLHLARRKPVPTT